MNIEPSSKIGALASRIPGAADVFTANGILYECDGTRTLESVCADLDLDVAAVTATLVSAARDGSDELCGWDSRPLADLVDHILNHYHARVGGELDRLEGLVDGLVTTCTAPDARVDELTELLRTFAAELREHVVKEERVLFPWVLSGNGINAGAPIRVMLAEHRTSAREVARVIEILSGPPADGAAVAWRALFDAVTAFAHSLSRHVHLENNVLFPRALAGETA